MQDKNQIDILDLFRSSERSIMTKINCHQVGIIHSFDATKQTAVVKLAVKRVIKEDKEGREIKEYPLLLDCPVFVLSGGDGHITFPIEQGDECLVLFNDRQIDNWFVSGSVEAPSIARTHDLSDGMVIVGFRSLRRVLANYKTDGIHIEYNDSKIDLESQRIQIDTIDGEINVDNIDINAAIKAKIEAATIELMSTVEAKIQAAILNIIAATEVNINAPITNLGVGGNAIARKGDEVTIVIPTGSSAGTYKGTITSGGVNTSL